MISDAIKARFAVEVAKYPAEQSQSAARDGRTATNISRVLDSSELCKCIDSAWENLGLDTISRAYLHHHQVVNAIARDKGGDEFITEKGGLHCGVQKHAVHYFENY